MTARKKVAASRSKPRATQTARPTKSRSKAQVVAPAEDVVAVPPAPVLEAPLLAETAPEVVTQTPETDFAARWTPAPALPPRPTQRRIIFIDVENTSRAGDVLKVLEHLTIDRVHVQTELVASGNWRVIGSETSRLLAKHGAQLVHSAPATGVRDWSDLRIAVAAGVWLASARPGDSIEIVSDDRAFDVVGDVAATLGIRFTRISYRHLPASAPSTEVASAPTQRASRGQSRRRRSIAAKATLAPSPPTTSQPAAEEVATTETPSPVQTATPVASPTEDILTLVRELLQRSNTGTISIDSVGRQLKRLGFERPAGAPRLVTRLKAFKELDVAPPGIIRLRHPGASPTPAPAEATSGSSPAQPKATSRRPRRRRRGRSQRSTGISPTPSAENPSA